MKSFMICTPYVFWVIKSRRTVWAGHMAHIRERRGAYNVLVGKPEGNKALEGPRHRWEDNIKMNVKDVGLVGVHGLD
jgi:hypothetical protein